MSLKKEIGSPNINEHFSWFMKWPVLLSSWTFHRVKLQLIKFYFVSVNSLTYLAHSWPSVFNVMKLCGPVRNEANPGIGEGILALNAVSLLDSIFFSIIIAFHFFWKLLSAPYFQKCVLTLFYIIKTFCAINILSTYTYICIFMKYNFDVLILLILPLSNLVKILFPSSRQQPRLPCYLGTAGVKQPVAGGDSRPG